MSAHRAKSPASANVLVQLVLQVDERVVRCCRKSDIAQNTGNYVRTHCLGLWLHNNLVQLLALVLDCVPRCLAKVQVSLECSSDTLDAEEIISIGGYFDLVDDLFADIDSVALVVVSCHLHFISSSDFQFNSILETEVFELGVC